MYIVTLIFLYSGVPGLKQSVSHKTLLSYCNSTCEVLIVMISEPEVILVMMHRPPNASTSAFNDIIKESENIIRVLNSPLPEIVIMGDFNFPGVLWDTAINSNNVIVNISGLVGLRDYLYLDQMITEPTRELNILDLLFCNQSIIESIKLQKTVISDHNIIHVNTDLKIVANHSTQDINPPRSVFEQLNFFKADWNTITQDISESNLVINVQQLNTRMLWVYLSSLLVIFVLIMHQ